MSIRGVLMPVTAAYKVFTMAAGHRVDRDVIVSNGLDRGAEVVTSTLS